MRTIMQFAAGATVGALAVMILVKSPTSATTAPTPQSISIEEVSRSVDLGALPVQEVKDPF